MTAEQLFNALLDDRPRWRKLGLKMPSHAKYIQLRNKIYEAERKGIDTKLEMPKKWIIERYLVQAGFTKHGHGKNATWS
jgi:hypothetical protein